MARSARRADRRSAPATAVRAPVPNGVPGSAEPPDGAGAVPPAGAVGMAPDAPRSTPAHAIPDDLLTRAPDEAVRLVSLALLAQAAAARDRLADASDAEALHDFRVALRRLRSTIRAHRALLEDSVPRKAQKQLRRAAQLSGGSRDLEVLLIWLDAQRGSLTSRHRAGAAWLRARLVRDKRKADAKLAHDVGPTFDKLRAKLERTLPVYWRRMHLHAPTGRARFAPVLAARLRDVSAALGDALVAVTGPEAVHESHEARIAAKRVRYLLEPVKPYVEGAGATIKRLREMQDAFGELHDLDVLGDVLAAAMADAEAEQAVLAREAALEAERRAAEATTASGDCAPSAGAAAMPIVAVGAGAAAEADDRRVGGRRASDPAAPAVAALAADARRDPRPGLAALARRARTRREALFAEIAGSWLSGAGSTLVAGLDRLAAALDATEDPHALPVEIERKYLLRSLPHALREMACAEIEQGWLPGERLLERVRRVRRDGDTRHYRTVKLGAGVSRVEIEEETTPELFEVLWPATAPRRVRKRRYAVADGGHTWEVDVFAGRDLVLAEVELPSPDTPVSLPGWLAPYVVREVTDDPGYVNANLAQPE